MARTLAEPTLRSLETVLELMIVLMFSTINSTVLVEDCQAQFDVEWNSAQT
jgi:hypothetical protein